MNVYVLIYCYGSCEDGDSRSVHLVGVFSSSELAYAWIERDRVIHGRYSAEIDRHETSVTGDEYYRVIEAGVDSPIIWNTWPYGEL